MSLNNCLNSPIVPASAVPSPSQSLFIPSHISFLGEDSSPGAPVIYIFSTANLS